MIGYEVEIEGLEQQLAKLRQYDAIADRRLIAAMQKSVITVESAVKPLTPVFQSRLRNSIASEVKHLGPVNIEGVVGSTLKDEVYPAVMEFGRKPGRMPPPSALERWVHLVLGVPDDEAPGVAFTVARAIGRRGIKGRFFMKKGWEASKGKVNAYFAQALELIAKDLENGRR